MALGKLRVSPWSSGLGCCGIKQALGVSFGLASTLLHMNDIGLVSRRCTDVSRVKSRVKMSTKKSSQKVIFVLCYSKADCNDYDYSIFNKRHVTMLLNDRGISKFSL